MAGKESGAPGRRRTKRRLSFSSNSAAQGDCLEVAVKEESDGPAVVPAFKKIKREESQNLEGDEDMAGIVSQYSAISMTSGEEGLEGGININYPAPVEGSRNLYNQEGNEENLNQKEGKEVEDDAAMEDVDRFSRDNTDNTTTTTTTASSIDTDITFPVDNENYKKNTSPLKTISNLPTPSKSTSTPTCSIEAALRSSIGNKNHNSASNSSPFFETPSKPSSSKDSPKSRSKILTKRPPRKPTRSSVSTTISEPHPPPPLPSPQFSIQIPPNSILTRTEYITFSSATSTPSTPISPTASTRERDIIPITPSRSRTQPSPNTLDSDMVYQKFIHEATGDAKTPRKSLVALDKSSRSLKLKENWRWEGFETDRGWGWLRDPDRDRGAEQAADDGAEEYFDGDGSPVAPRRKRERRRSVWAPE